MNSIATILHRIGRFAATAALALMTTLPSAPLSAGEPSQVGVYDMNVGHGLTFTGNPEEPPAPLALRGYDTVSYFTNDAPQLGTVAHALYHEGAIYWFASAEHKAMFKADPDRYLPRYGGFCAFGVTQQTKFDGDPLLWNIHDGRLYLNVTPDLQDKWLGKGLIGNSLEENIASADQIWPGISDAKPQPLFAAWLARQ